MEGAVVTSGGGLKFNITQFMVTIVVVVVMILLLSRVLKFNLVDSAGNTVSEIKPALNIG